MPQKVKTKLHVELKKIAENFMSFFKVFSFFFPKENVQQTARNQAAWSQGENTGLFLRHFKNNSRNFEQK